ncbi:uridine kinase [Actinomadura monticuli]|uniref:Uridine kinase n=1 Tax=Actinomadura monticuli TaxID=3097367 RepID=A0ABV4QKU8_9ACTN
MGVERAPVHHSVSTWRQPTPPPGTPQRHAVVERVAERVLRLGEGRLRVAIDGRTAAGKTSLGHELAERISAAGRPVLRASLDDFKRPWREAHLYDRTSGEGYYRNAFDYTAVTTLLLQPSGPRGSGQCALCGIDPLTQRDHSSNVVQAPPDAVLVVDGVFAFRPQINAYWDLRIWLEVDAEVSIQRGIARDRAREGTEAETLHRDRYLPAERLYMAEVDPARLAEVIIGNNEIDRPRILRI